MKEDEKLDKIFQFRVTQGWQDRLDATIREMATQGKEPPSRASFVRETIEMENILWRRSPYVCDTSSHYVLVTRGGDYLYLRRELLFLRSDLLSIPAHLETQLGKRAAPDLWLLNAFVLRYDNRTVVKSVQEGTTSKSTLFDGPFIEGSRIKREGFFVLRNYANYSHGSKNAMEALYGRADFEVDVPTRNLDILMVVDPLLYGENPTLEKPALKFDIRNRDGVAFLSPDAVNHFLSKANLIRIGNVYEPGMENSRDELYRDTIRLAREHREDYVRSLQEIKGQVKDGPAAEKFDHACELMVLPERFLFYRVAWTGAHIGLTCSIRFPKPHNSEEDR